jgi:hypothetical protein
VCQLWPGRRQKVELEGTFHPALKANPALKATKSVTEQKVCMLVVTQSRESSLTELIGKRVTSDQSLFEPDFINLIDWEPRIPSFTRACILFVNDVSDNYAYANLVSLRSFRTVQL